MRSRPSSPSSTLATSALGASLLALTLCLVGRYFWRAPAAVRAQLQVLAVGAVLALSPIVALTLTEPLTGGSAPQNAVGFTSFLFFLSLGYAALGGPQPRTEATRR